MKKVYLKKWLENLLIGFCVFGLFLIGILEHNNVTLYIYGTILVVLPTILLVKYGRD